MTVPIRQDGFLVIKRGGLSGLVLEFCTSEDEARAVADGMLTPKDQMPKEYSPAPVYVVKAAQFLAE